MGRIWVFGYMAMSGQEHFICMKLHVPGHRLGKFGISVGEELKLIETAYFCLLVMDLKY